MNKTYSIKCWTDNPSEFESVIQIPTIEQAKQLQSDLAEEGYQSLIEEERE